MTERKPEWALYQPASSSKDCFSATASLPGLTITVTILFFCIFAPEASWTQLRIVNECGIISDAMEESTSFLVKAGGPDKHQLFVNSNLAYYIVCIGLTKTYT